MESLVLEINLIKQHDPKYNIMLTDDKTYPYILLTSEKYPRLMVIRTKHKTKKQAIFLDLILMFMQLGRLVIY